MLTKKRNISGFVIIAIVQIVLLLLLPEDDVFPSKDWSERIAVYSFLILLFQLLALRYVLPPKTILMPAFLVLSYFFTISQVVLNAFGYQLPGSLEFASVFKQNNVAYATNVSIKGIATFFLGIVAYYTFLIKKEKKDVVQTRRLRQPNIMFVFVVVALGFVFDLANTIYMGITLGYGEVEGNQITIILKILSLLLPSGIALLLTRETLSSSFKLNVLIVFVLYKFFCMFLGYRAYALINIILAIYLYSKLNNKLNFSIKKILTYGFVGVFLSIVLVTIKDYRKTGFDLDFIVERAGSSGFSSIFEVLAENGITLHVVCVVLDEMRGIGTGGGQLVASILSIVPGISSLLPSYKFEDMVMDSALSLRQAGGSYIADMIFDFGDPGYLVALFLLAILYCKIIGTFERSINNGRFIYVSVMFPIIVDMFFCIRSSLAKLPREIVWYFLIFYALWIILCGRGFKMKL